MIRRIATLLLILVLVSSVLVGCSSNSADGDGGANEKQYTIKIGHVLDQSHHYTYGANKFKELVEERSNGQIKVDVYPNGQLGGEREMLEGMQLGTIEMGIITTAPLAGFVPEVALLDMGYLFDSNEQAQEVLHGPVGDMINEKMVEQGLRRLAILDCGWRHVYSAKPINSIEDLAGMKIRTMETPAHLELFKALGANPLPMAYTELYTALQQGVVDGAENTVDAYYTSRHYEVANQYSLTKHVYLTVFFVISENFYSQLPEDLQDIVAQAAVEAAEYENEVIYQQQEEFMSELENAGVDIVEIEDMEPFVEKAKDSWVKIAEATPGGMELLEAILDATGKSLD